MDLLDMSQWPAWLLPAIIVAVVAAIVGGLAMHFFRRNDEPQVFVRPPRSEHKSDKKNQRGMLRRGGNPVDIFISDESAQQAPIAALVVDRSLKGLCLGVTMSYDSGTVLSIRRTDNSTPWVRVVVKNCRLVAGTYEVGCEFVAIPPASVLMMFG